ncbi:NAD(P)H-dependent oxidoreductase [Gimibacter soli]|uniref:NAD(P)H-dependent oxidoreductase n=1 Tax=Gimibacter soli TaxID=3024400 RepID=A0AAF0BKE4_9PROT|nr:NAD(P)H-dependent oxidoreductase [Gimibacter soli]WCL52877.1 NAD(P)H-dependent oxidoreductase [Gimibacter soli]
MSRKILILQGHPDGRGGHFCHALANAYAEGAVKAGHAVGTIDVASIEGLTFMTDPADFAKPAPAPIAAAQDAVMECDHMVIIFPLWLGMLPATLKAFLEQLSRSEFVLGANDKGGWPAQKLKGRSAHVIVTMGMPGFAFRLFFRAHGVKALETAFLRISGVKPVKNTYIGGVEAMGDKGRKGWLERIRNVAASLR